MSQTLYGKYNVTKADGTPTDPNAQYFVLRIDTDPAARLALHTYADAQPDPVFQDQLKEWIKRFEPMPTDTSRLAIWWLNGHSDNEAVIEAAENRALLPAYIYSEVVGLHGRPTRGRLWVPNEIEIEEIQWDHTKPRASEAENCGGIVIWRKDLRYLKGLPGFVTDTQMNEISLK